MLFWNIILPGDYLGLAWDLLMLLVILYLCVALPYTVAFAIDFVSILQRTWLHACAQLPLQTLLCQWPPRSCRVCNQKLWLGARLAWLLDLVGISKFKRPPLLAWLACNHYVAETSGADGHQYGVTQLQVACNLQT